MGRNEIIDRKGSLGLADELGGLRGKSICVLRYELIQGPVSQMRNRELDSYLERGEGFMIILIEKVHLTM